MRQEEKTFKKRQHSLISLPFSFFFSSCSPTVSNGQLEKVKDIFIRTQRTGRGWFLSNDYLRSRRNCIHTNLFPASEWTDLVRFSTLSEFLEVLPILGSLNMKFKQLTKFAVFHRQRSTFCYAHTFTIINYSACGVTICQATRRPWPRASLFLCFSHVNFLRFRPLFCFSTNNLYLVLLSKRLFNSRLALSRCGKATVNVLYLDFNSVPDALLLRTREIAMCPRGRWG